MRAPTPHGFALKVSLPRRIHLPKRSSNENDAILQRVVKIYHLTDCFLRVLFCSSLFRAENLNRGAR